MARHGRRSERGQASLEWVAVVAVVAVVLAGAGTLGAAPGLVNAVSAALQRAICLVSGGSCTPAEPQACVVASSDGRVRAGVKLTFLELGGRFGLLRELRSDGTVRLTLVDEGELGATAGAGGRARVELAGLLDARAGAMAQAEIVARLGRRRSWEAASVREADALSRRIVRHVAEQVLRGSAVLGPAIDAASRVAGRDRAPLPEPHEESLGAELEGGVSAGLDLGAQARAGLEAGLGATRDRAGGREIVLALSGEASADLRQTLLGLHAEGSASVAAAMSFDREGRPLRLELSAAGTASGWGSLSGAGPRGRDERGSRTDVTGTLDLTRPAHAAAAARLLAALAPGHAARLPGAAAELARLLASSGTLRRERRSTSRDGYGAGVEAALGPEVGVEVEVSRVASRLEDAWWRPPGGVWERRVDCVGHRA